MKKTSFFLFFTLLCFIMLTSCEGSTVTDVDKHLRNAKQAVEELYNNPPSEMKLLKEAVKFKENDKLSDYQQKEFFKQVKARKLKVTAKKAKVKDGYTEVTCDVTLSDGSVKEKKFHLIKEDNIWKTEIGYSQLQDAIYK